MSGMKVRGLKTRMGWECCIGRRRQMGQVEQWRHTTWGVSKKQDTMLVGVGFPEEAGTHQREQLHEL